MALRDLIGEKYPALDFVIIAFGIGEDYDNSWNLERIRNFNCGRQNRDKACFKKNIDLIVEEFGKSNQEAYQQ